MDNSDAKYLKRKVKAGSLDVHPTEKALVVNYELEATILGELGDPMLGERKECQKIIRLKSLNAQTDIRALAKEVINKCKLIHPSKIPEVEQLLYYLQKRKDKSESPPEQRAQSASFHRYSPIDDDDSKIEPKTSIVANINDVEDYIEYLYEDVPSKVQGSDLILQLARNPDNLEELSTNETLLGALSRVLREEWKCSIDLSTNIIYVFFCFSTFSQFHPIILHYKVGSLVMDIMDYELHRYYQGIDDLKKLKRSTSSEKSTTLEHEAETRFQAFVHKQEQALRVSVYLLLNLSEDVKVEEKMKKKKILPMLVSLLERDNDELLILVVSFLKKLSVFRENKDEIGELGAIEKLSRIFLQRDVINTDLINAVLRLLMNLSFDFELRNKMIKSGLLPKLVEILQDSRNQNAACCVLYHLSFDDKVKSMFTYTDCIPIVMKLILERTKFSNYDCQLDVMALAINLAANKRNAQLICEGNGLRVLMQTAFHHQDVLIVKMIRNISQHDGITKNLFIEFIGDIADAVQRATSREFAVECLGILGNLTIPDLDYERLLKEYDMIPWMKEKLCFSVEREKKDIMDDDDIDDIDVDDDDLILEIVVFIGTCASDSSSAMYLCKSNVLMCLIELLKAKQEDDEIVLQVVYVFYQLCTHENTRQIVIAESEAVAYLIDLMHDKNSEIQRVCDATLDIISEINSNWAERVKREKFRFHNAQWLEIIQTQEEEEDEEEEEEEDNEEDKDFDRNGDGESCSKLADDLFNGYDDDNGTFILNDPLIDLETSGGDLIISSGSSEDYHRIQPHTISSRPTSAYRRTAAQY